MRIDRTASIKIWIMDGLKTRNYDPYQVEHGLSFLGFGLYFTLTFMVVILNGFSVIVSNELRKEKRCAIKLIKWLVN